MMHTINYNYKIGDIVYIVDDTLILECQVTQITLEIDPDVGDGLVEIKTYHVHVLTDKYTIKLRPEELTFPNSDMAVDHMCDPSVVAPPSDTPQTVSYDYIPDDIVWSYDGQVPIEATVTQVTVDIDPVEPDGYKERVIYHILPVEGTHSTLLREDYEVFDTKQEAVDYIQYLMEQELTPTPTISITPSVTPTNTPTPTNLPPTPTVTPSVTPPTTPMVTPTMSLSATPVWPYIPLD